MDGNQLGTFISAPNGTSPVYAYNTLLWSTDSLSQGEHELIIRNGHDGGPVSLLLLDYIMDTTYAMFDALVILLAVRLNLRIVETTHYLKFHLP